MYDISYYGMTVQYDRRYVKVLHASAGLRCYISICIVVEARLSAAWALVRVRFIICVNLVVVLGMIFRNVSGDFAGSLCRQASRSCNMNGSNG